LQDPEKVGREGGQKKDTEGEILGGLEKRKGRGKFSVGRYWMIRFKVPANGGERKKLRLAWSEGKLGKEKTRRSSDDKKCKGMFDLAAWGGGRAGRIEMRLLYSSKETRC